MHPNDIAALAERWAQKTVDQLTSNQGRHLESGQYLNKTGSSPKQVSAMAKKGALPGNTPDTLGTDEDAPAKPNFSGTTVDRLRPDGPPMHEAQQEDDHFFTEEGADDMETDGAGEDGETIERDRPMGRTGPSYNSNNGQDNMGRTTSNSRIIVVDGPTEEIPWLVKNAFCATGQGGGQDNSCGKEGGGAGGDSGGGGSDSGGGGLGKISRGDSSDVSQAGAKVHGRESIAKLAYENTALKLDDVVGKTIRTVVDKDAREEAAGIAKGIFARMTLGMGPLAIAAAKVGGKIAAKSFDLIVKGMDRMGQASGGSRIGQGQAVTLGGGTRNSSVYNDGEDQTGAAAPPANGKGGDKYAVATEVLKQLHTLWTEDPQEAANFAHALAVLAKTNPEIAQLPGASPAVPAPTPQPAPAQPAALSSSQGQVPAQNMKGCSCGATVKNSRGKCTTCGGMVTNDPMESGLTASDEDRLVAPNTETMSGFSTMNRRGDDDEDNRCPECGGKVDEDGDCEECGEHVENAEGIVPPHMEEEQDGNQAPTPPATASPGHSATTAAFGASARAGRLNPKGRAMRALEASHGNDTEGAAEHHAGAAEEHEWAATEARRGQDDQGAEDHDNAAALHRKAASIHAATMNQTHNQKGRRSTRSKEAGMALTFAQRSYLIDNCKCSEEAKGALHTLSDNDLRRLARNAKAEGSNADATGEGEEQVGGDGKEFDNGRTPGQEVEETSASAALSGKGKGPGLTKNSAGKSTRQLEQEYIDAAPTENIREMLHEAVQNRQQQRVNLLNQLTANIADAQERGRLRAEWASLPMKKLRDMAKIVPAFNARPGPMVAPSNYLGAAAPVNPTTNSGAGDEELVLRPLTMNWADNPFEAGKVK